MKKTLITLISFIFLVANTLARTMNPYLGVKGANFLKIGLSPKAEGMGSAYTSYGTDINSIYYNPAGLCYLTKPQAQISTLDWIDNVNINFFAYAQKIEKIKGIFSSSLTTLSLSPIIHYNDWGEEIGTLSFFNMALTSSYARKFGDFYTGANLKFIYQKIADKNNFGLAFDLGVIKELNDFSINLMNKYLIVIRDFKLGMVLKNIGTKAGADSLPLSLEFGYSIRLIKNLHLAIAIIKPIYTAESLIDSDYKMNFGIEYVFQKIFYIRNGFKINYDINNNFTTGFGVKTKFFGGTIQVDYAYAAYTYLEKTNKISLTVEFNNFPFWKKK